MTDTADKKPTGRMENALATARGVDALAIWKSVGDF